MPTPNFLDENPAIDGPDYVALVIEWDELADDLERKLYTEQMPQTVAPKQRSFGALAKVAGTVGAIALAWLVVHRIRA